MANIEVLVSSTPTGGVKIWARDSDRGRVCYGALSGSTLGLKIEDSSVTSADKLKKRYVRAINVYDGSFGGADDAVLKGIVGGISRALTENPEAIEWDSVESRTARHMSQNGVDRDYLARLLNPMSRGQVWALTICSLDFLSTDDDDTSPGFAPLPQIVSAVATVDANWNF